MVASVLAAAADQAIGAEQVEVAVLAAVDKLRQAEEKRAVAALLTQPLSSLSTAQREMLAKAGRKG